MSASTNAAGSCTLLRCSGWLMPHSRRACGLYAPSGCNVAESACSHSVALRGRPRNQVQQRAPRAAPLPVSAIVNERGQARCHHVQLDQHRRFRRAVQRQAVHAEAESCRVHPDRSRAR